MKIRSAYLAHQGFVDPLLQELADGSCRTHGDLVLSEEPCRKTAWAVNHWQNPQELAVRSIGHAACLLREKQRNWSPYAPIYHRRAELIRQRLPHVSSRPIRFPDDPPTSPLGSYTLLGPNLMLASAECSSPFPNGEARFVENHEDPPSRAYLKLWELFTRLRKRPAQDDRCLDLGGSPGGWTWVLARLGASVLVVDRAPLDPRVAALPGVSLLRSSAFGLDPCSKERVDWLFSDVVAYPNRLIKLVDRWIASGKCDRIVCTVKFQGRSSYTAGRSFAEIPGSTLMHLFHNKNELTWYWERDATGRRER